MGDDRYHSSAGQLEEVLVSVWRDPVVAELDQQVSRSIDGVARRVLNGIGDVLIREVEVTSNAELNASAGSLPQLGKHAFIALPVVDKLVVAVRGRNNVPDSIVGGDTTHLGSHLPRAGAVVDVRQYMALDVDHNRVGTCSVSRAESSRASGGSGLWPRKLPSCTFKQARLNLNGAKSSRHHSYGEGVDGEQAQHQWC